MQGKIKLVSGWSNPGGSTIHHINLTNLLNANGYDCTFYGPHDWHLNKCKSARLNECSINVHDTVISHFIQVNGKNLRKHILSCHESNLFPLKQIPHDHYDVIQFVSNRQKQYHSINHPSVIIPPIVEKFKWESPRANRAGVIGSIDSHKQTHISIQNALEDGYDEVYLFGQITDLEYFNREIKPLMGSKVYIKNHYDNKEEMYSLVDAVYSNSKFETYGLVEAECTLNHIPFGGISNKPEILTNEEILERWKTILE
jgi:hypothetical protein